MTKANLSLLTYLLKVVRNVAGEDHFDDDLAHVPILCFTKQLEDIVLRVE